VETEGTETEAKDGKNERPCQRKRELTWLAVKRRINDEMILMDE
jgi:hypothetical protein